MNNGIQIRISDLIFALQKRWKMIVAATFVGLVLGLLLVAMTFVQSSMQNYQIAGSFTITTQSENGLFVNGFTNAGNNDFHLAEDMADAAIYVVRSHRVISEVINDLGLLTTSVEQLKKALTVKQYGGTQIIEMSLVWNQAEDGLTIWNAIVDHASALMPSTLQLGGLAIIDNPQVMTLGMGYSGVMTPVLLAMLGLMCGVGYAVLELLMRPTLNNVRDVETFFSLETIGLIPRDDTYFRRRKSLLVTEDMGVSEIEQNYSAAAYILRNQLGTKDEHHCFFVTSATTQEGKSTVAANLAVQLSEMGHRTLLIDFDTRNPSLGALFLDKVSYAHSLNALYRGDASREDAIITLTGYLDLMPTVLEHGSIPMDGLVVELIQQLTQEYEYVIMDAAPVGMVSDPLSLKQVASNVLFVIGYDTSTIPEIQKSLEKLYKSGLRVIGCIVNGVQSGRMRTGGKDDSSKRNHGQRKEDAASPEEKLKEAVPEVHGSMSAMMNTEPAEDSVSPAMPEAEPQPEDAGAHEDAGKHEDEAQPEQMEPAEQPDGQPEATDIVTTDEDEQGIIVMDSHTQVLPARRNPLLDLQGDESDLPLTDSDTQDAVDALLRPSLDERRDEEEAAPESDGKNEKKKKDKKKKHKNAHSDT